MEPARAASRIGLWAIWLLVPLGVGAGGVFAAPDRPDAGIGPEPAPPGPAPSPPSNRVPSHVERGLRVEQGPWHGERVPLQAPRVVEIRAGWFEMGLHLESLEAAVALCRQDAPAEACDASRFAMEQPSRQVFVHAFGIDRTEVSQADYLRCQRDLRCEPPPPLNQDGRIAGPELPAVMVRAQDAEQYCEWAGGRLPSEAEWERAARGGGRRAFPWGRFYNSRVANHGTAQGAPDPVDGFPFAAPVGAFRRTLSAHGLLNMAGNVWEWTADDFAEDAYERLGEVGPQFSAGGGVRTIRGGSWRTGPLDLRATARRGLLPGERRADVGFRCAYDR